MENLIEVAKVPLRYEAHLIKGRLEAEGIKCFLYGDALAGVVGERAYPTSTWSDPLGGIKVYVKPEDVAAARSILQELEDRADNETSTRRDFPLVWQAAFAIPIAILVQQNLRVVMSPVVSWSVTLLAVLGLLASSFKRGSRF